MVFLVQHNDTVSSLRGLGGSILIEIEMNGDSVRIVLGA